MQGSLANKIVFQFHKNSEPSYRCSLKPYQSLRTWLFPLVVFNTNLEWSISISERFRASTSIVQSELIYNRIDYVKRCKVDCFCFTRMQSTVSEEVNSTEIWLERVVQRQPAQYSNDSRLINDARSDQCYLLTVIYCVPDAVCLRHRDKSAERDSDQHSKAENLWQMPQPCIVFLVLFPCFSVHNCSAATLIPAKYESVHPCSQERCDWI